jgi:hypothetical protein
LEAIFLHEVGVFVGSNVAALAEFSVIWTRRCGGFLPEAVAAA